MVNIGVGFLFVVNSIALFIGMFLLDTKKVINRIL